MKARIEKIKGGHLFATGAVSKLDFKRCGYVDVTLSVTNKKIVIIEVAGFSSEYAPEVSYTFEPKSRIDVQRNKIFIDRLNSSSTDIVNMVNNIIANKGLKNY